MTSQYDRVNLSSSIMDDLYKMDDTLLLKKKYILFYLLFRPTLDQETILPNLFLYFSGYLSVFVIELCYWLIWFFFMWYSHKVY